VKCYDLGSKKAMDPKELRRRLDLERRLGVDVLFRKPGRAQKLKDLELLISVFYEHAS